MEAIQNVNVASLLDSLVSLATAFVFGGLIGFERQYRQRLDMRSYCRAKRSMLPIRRNSLLPGPASTGAALIFSDTKEPEQQENRSCRDSKSGAAGCSDKSAAVPSGGLIRRERMCSFPAIPVSRFGR